MKKLFLYLAIMASSVCFFLIFVLVFLNGTVVQCTQQADKSYSCSIQTMLFGKFPTFKREIEKIVDVAVVDDGCFEGCGYRTEFVLADGSSVPLTEVYTDENPVNIQAMELRSLLTSGKPSFEYIKEPIWWVAYLIGGLFVMEFFVITLSMGLPALREALANRQKF